MTPTEYLVWAARHTILNRFSDTVHGFQTMYAASGVAKEAGELLEIAHKHFFVGVPFYSADTPKEQLIDEVGDVLYNIALLLFELDTSFEDVMKLSKEKLAAREEARLETSTPR